MKDLYEENILKHASRLLADLPDFQGIIESIKFPQLDFTMHEEVYAHCAKSMTSLGEAAEHLVNQTQQIEKVVQAASISPIEIALKNIPTFPLFDYSHLVTETQIASDQTCDKEKDVDVPPVYKESLDLNVDNIVEVLPIDAELLDAYIAIRCTNELYFMVNGVWIRYSVGKMAISLIRYLQNVAIYPNQRLKRLTDLKKFSKAKERRYQLTSISNALKKIEKLCKKHNCKPIIITSANRHTYNLQLDHAKKLRV